MSVAKKGEVFQENKIDPDSKTYTVHQKYTRKWTVKNVHHISRDIPIIVPTFCLEPNGEWHVEIKSTSDFSIYFYLCRHDKETDINVDYRITVSSLDGDEICKETSVLEYTKEKTIHNLFPKISVHIYDVILITLQLKIISSQLTIVLETAQSEEFKIQTMNTLTKDYKSLFISHKHADVILRVKKQERLSVHKAILSVRSPVFEKMFEHERTLEQQDNIVDIEDLDMSTLKELVSFMYSGELVDYDFETAMQVYFAADKYGVLELRQHCGHRVVSGLTRLNAGRALTLAEKHDDHSLRDAVCDFILRHYHQDKRNT